EHYAAEDVRHLVALRERLAGELRARRREGWVDEECRALEATPAADRVFDPDDCFRIKGVRMLDRRGLGVLREMFVAREAWAHARGRPPFKVLGNDTLLRLAAERPTTEDALARIPGCTPTVLGRHGDGILQAIARGLGIPESALPLLRRPVKPRVAPAVARRIGALVDWRAEAAPRVGLDPGLVLPRRLIERLAESAPTDLETLQAVEGIRRWRVGAFGPEILGALAGKDGHAHRRQTGDGLPAGREGAGGA
ncbi:MAG: hypothetical protein EHM71_10760, partial [Zetaproteobacteria bacterium]